MLVNGTVDIAFSELMQTQARHSVISFSYPVFFEPEALFLSCVPVTSLGSSFSISDIFDLSIWLCLAASILFCFLQLTFVTKMLTDHSIGLTVTIAFWQIVETVCFLRYRTEQQEKRVATRVIQICFAFLISLIRLRGILSSDLYASFRQIPQGPLEDWQTFADSCKTGKTRLVVRQGEAPTAFLAEKIDFRQFRVTELVATADSVQLVSDGHVLLATHPEVVDVAMRLETREMKCFMADLGFHSGKYLMSFGLRKGVNFEFLDRFILRLHETGVLTHIYRQFVAQWRPIESAHSPRITLDLIAPVMRFFAYVGVAELCVLIIEILVYRCVMHANS